MTMLDHVRGTYVSVRARSEKVARRLFDEQFGIRHAVIHESTEPDARGFQIFKTKIPRKSCNGLSF